VAGVLLSGQGWRPDPLAADPLPAADDQRSESLILDASKSGTMASNDAGEYVDVSEARILLRVGSESQVKSIRWKWVERQRCVKAATEVAAR